MAKIEDLIVQIPDERLRKAIAGEVKALKKTKKFGLVFEEHLPETLSPDRNLFMALDLHKRLAKAKAPDDKTKFQRQIGTPDREIDRLVYDLYGLTGEEIRIVEGAAK